MSFNGQVIDRIVLSDIATEIRLTLPPPYPSADRNILQITADDGKAFTVTGFELID